MPNTETYQRAHRRGALIMAYAGALETYAFIIRVAVTHHPAGVVRPDQTMVLRVFRTRSRMHAAFLAALSARKPKVDPNAVFLRAVRVVSEDSAAPNPRAPVAAGSG